MKIYKDKSQGKYSDYDHSDSYSEFLFNDVRPSAGIPPVQYISGVLLNILLDDIDKMIEKRMPNFKYVRYSNDIVIPIYNHQCESDIISELIKILTECNFESFTAERTHRQGTTFLIQDKGFRLDKFGRCIDPKIFHKEEKPRIVPYFKSGSKSC